MNELKKEMFSQMIEICLSGCLFDRMVDVRFGRVWEYALRMRGDYDDNNENFFTLSFRCMCNNDFTAEKYHTINWNRIHYSRAHLYHSNNMTAVSVWASEHTIVGAKRMAAAYECSI